MSEQKQENGTGGNEKRNSLAAWLITVVLCAALLSILVWQPKVASSMEWRNLTVLTPEYEQPETFSQNALDHMPQFFPQSGKQLLIREPQTHTEIDTSLRTTAVEYTVQEGDAIFGIAEKFDVSPDSIMWSNEDILNDNPHLIYAGQVLKIPPTDGVWYKLTTKDTLEKVAAKFHVTVRDILLYVGNSLDLTNPTIEPESYVMVPDGWREYDTSIYVPNILRDNPSGNAGVTTSEYFQCDTGGNTYAGSGNFIWPSSVHYISGNDYFGGHLAIDIGAGMGSPIYAADYGVVVYAGWMNGGYGNVIIIDHNNGFSTVYAHLSGINVNCGNNVNQGSVIGYAGSTGNSTGAHLHFEIRYNGSWVNPHLWLP
ncbi:MAG: peptidoglycan DD-metalloendopeptidase family protein [Anaerolineaceae bacterium]